MKRFNKKHFLLKYFNIIRKCKRLISRTLNLFKAVTVVFAFGFIIWIFFAGVWDELSAKEKVDFLIKGITTLSTISGAIFVLFKFISDREQFQAMQESNLEQLQVSRNQFEYTQKSERLATAVESLESEKLYVRLGGIYSLEVLAQQFESIHWTVMEILMSFIKIKASEANYPLPDIQAAFTVICRRNPEFDKEKELDFRRANLSGLELLDGGNLERACLEGALLEKTHFVRVKLNKANLSKTNLKGSKFVQCEFDKAILDKANLASIKMENINFNHTSLKGASFKNSTLENINFNSGSELDNTLFCDATLSNIGFLGKDSLPLSMKGSFMIRTRFYGVHFSHCCLVEADLRLAQFVNQENHKKSNLVSNTDFEKADLRGITLSGVEIKDSFFRDSDISSCTVYYSEDNMDSGEDSYRVDIEISSPWLLEIRQDNFPYEHQEPDSDSLYFFHSPEGQDKGCRHTDLPTSLDASVIVNVDFSNATIGKTSIPAKYAWIEEQVRRP
jgi:uncharacterized protein YjbI with pentapeptide repeats